MKKCTTKILAFAGSTREASFNKKLAKLAVQHMAQDSVEINFLDLRDYPMPFYDGDLEASEGCPEMALKFREQLDAHHGFLICSPEYNSSVSAVLKNAIDWASRPKAGETNLHCFIGKVVCLMSASPGKLGGIRGLVPLRSILGNIGSIVIPDQLCIPFANKAFREDGGLADPDLEKLFINLCQNFVKLCTKIQISDDCIRAIQAES